MNVEPLQVRLTRQLPGPAGRVQRAHICKQLHKEVSKDSYSLSQEDTDFHDKAWLAALSFINMNSESVLHVIPCSALHAAGCATQDKSTIAAVLQATNLMV